MIHWFYACEDKENNQQSMKKVSKTAVSSFNKYIHLPFCPLLLLGKLFVVIKCFKQVLVFKVED